MAVKWTLPLQPQRQSNGRIFILDANSVRVCELNTNDFSETAAQSHMWAIIEAVNNIADKPDVLTLRIDKETALHMTGLTGHRNLAVHASLLRRHKAGGEDVEDSRIEWYERMAAKMKSISDQLYDFLEEESK